MMAFIRFNGRRGQKYSPAANTWAVSTVCGDGGRSEWRRYNHEPPGLRGILPPQRAYRKAPPGLLRHDHPTIVSLSPVNYAVSACVGALHGRADRPGNRGLLPGVRATEHDAYPNQFTQQINFPLALSRRRAFSNDEREVEVDEGK